MAMDLQRMICSCSHIHQTPDITSTVNTGRKKKQKKNHQTMTQRVESNRVQSPGNRTSDLLIYILLCDLLILYVLANSGRYFKNHVKICVKIKVC